MPVVPAGRARAVRIGLLVAGNTLKRRYAFTARTAQHVSEVRLSVIALLGIARSGVTVDASRTGQYRIDLLPGLETVTTPRSSLRNGCRGGRSRRADEEHPSPRTKQKDRYCPLYRVIPCHSSSSLRLMSDAFALPFVARSVESHAVHLSAHERAAPRRRLTNWIVSSIE